MGFVNAFIKLYYKSSIRWLFCKKIYRALDELQADLDKWLAKYNNQRTHQGKMCCGRTPMATSHDGKQLWREKDLNQI